MTTTRLTFTEGKEAKEDVKELYKSLELRLFDLNLNGKIDSEKEPIIISNINSLVNIPTKSGTVSVLPSVAEDYKKLKTYYFSNVSRNRNSLIDMEPRQGWINFENFKNESTSQFYKTFNLYLSNKCIKNFKHLMELYINYLKLYSREISFTVSGLLLSKFNNNLTTGLCIDLYDGDLSNKETKENFIKDPNYKFLLKASKKFNFRIDPVIPWRLIYIYNTNLNSYYLKLYNKELDYLISSSYFVVRVYTAEKEVSSETFSTIKKFDFPNNEEEFKKKFPVVYWLRVYLELKLAENNIQLSENEIINLTNEANKLYTFVGQHKSLQFINKHVNSISRKSFLNQ